MHACCEPVGDACCLGLLQPPRIIPKRTHRHIVRLCMSRAHTVLLLLVAVVAGMVALSEPDRWWKAVGARPTGDPPRHLPPPRRGTVIEPDVSLPVPENGSVAAVTATVPRDNPRTTKPPAATKASSEPQPHPLGNLTVFPGRLRALRGRGGVRVSVSVEMAGHMREYQRCAHALRQRVLAPLGASLTVAAPAPAPPWPPRRSTPISPVRRTWVPPHSSTE